MTPAIAHTNQLSQKTAISIISPTLSRKTGTKRLFPTKLIRFISGLWFGTRPFSATPHTNAPRMASRPDHSANHAEAMSSTMTSIKAVAASCQRLKTSWQSNGKSHSIKPNMTATLASEIYHLTDVSFAVRNANANSDSVMVSIVPPTTMFTVGVFCMP